MAVQVETLQSMNASLAVFAATAGICFGGLGLAKNVEAGYLETAGDPAMAQEALATSENMLFSAAGLLGVAAFNGTIFILGSPSRKRTEDTLPVNNPGVFVIR